MKTKLSILSALLAALALHGSAHAAPARLDQYGRWLVDPEHRVVMLRGGNMLLHTDSRSPGHESGANTPRLMAAEGFNGVRLVVFFSALMPRPGVLDDGYLGDIDKAVADYRNAGMYVLVDFHQDEYGASVGVRGFPRWATFAGGHAPAGLPFPAGYFSDPAVQVAFDNFWRNHPVPGTDKGVQDFYIDGLVAVARQIRDNPAVIGIDVMNEPFPGSRCNQPDPAVADCPELERELLAPFYRRAGAAIAAVAPEMIVFVEPFMLQGALGLPIQTPVPGEPAKRGLSFHNYGTLGEIRGRVNRNALASALATGSVILNTEWGFTNDPVEWNTQAAELDAHLIPWMAWARGPFAPLVDSSLAPAGNDNREATLRALARPYPRATAGTPKRLAFAPDSGTLEFIYDTAGPDGRVQADGITEIVMPRANFPAGYIVTLGEAQGSVVSAADAPLLQVRTAPGAARVEIRVQRKGELPPLPEPVRTEDPYAFLNAASSAEPAANGRLSTASMLGDLLGDDRARAVLQREVPELVNSPQVGMGSQMSLRALQPFVPEMLTDDVLRRLDAALDALQ